MAFGLQVILLLLTSGTFYVPACSSDQLHVYIDADSGEDSAKCLNSSSPCRSLSFVAEYLNQTESVVIEIKSQYLNLEKSLEFNSTYDHLTIAGSGNTTLYCNVSKAGLAFVGVKNLTIHSMTIEHCGALRESTSTDPDRTNKTERLSVAVYLLNCTDVTIDSVDVKSSNGTGLSLYDTNGTVSIENCNFIDNNMHKVKGGGGLHIEFTLCTPGRVGSCSSHDGRNHHSNYTIQKCNFWNNVAVGNPLYTALLLLLMNDYPIVGKGGGILVSIESDAMENSFTIEDCHFQNNSADLVGGGMVIQFLNSVQNNTIEIYNTSFVDNHCEECMGGGLVIGLMFYNLKEMLPIGNTFLCSDCKFKHNSAKTCGGTTLTATKVRNSTATQNSITFVHCKWANNRSPVGAAVCVRPAAWDYLTEGFLPKPLFSDCTFVLNSAFQTINMPSNGLKVKSVGYGAMFATELRVFFEGKNNFTGNKGSAIYLLNSVLEFHEESDVIFHNNTAHNGGAIAMFGSSALHFNNHSTFNFTKNTAYSTGGAIYVDLTIAIGSVYYNCFISSSITRNNSADFYFAGNYAKRNYGASVFATSFGLCKALCLRQNVSIRNPQEILQCIANFHFNDETNNSSPIATHPFDFTLQTEVRLSPGSEYYLPLTVSDEDNNTLTGIVYEATAILNNNVRVDPAFSQVSNNTICIYGNIGDTAELQLDTSDATLSFNITLVDCEPGYVHKNRTCECAAVDYLGLVTCNPKVLIRHGYWMGFCAPNSSTLCTSYCPYGFCSYHKMKPGSRVHPLPNNASMLDYAICGPSRTGRLCGKCADNHSVYFHSSKYTCGPEGLCHLGWVFYLVSEIVPLTLFFVIVLVFNISFTNGSINSFVFYAQVLSALATNGNGSIEFPNTTNLIRNTLAFFYRPFNLDFFSLEKLSFCLWRGATVMDVFIMKYTTVGFALVLVLLTILIARRRCRWYKIFARFNTPDSVLIHGLSAFFVLCYSQCARVTFHILAYFCVYSYDLKCEEKVVNRAGDMNYFEGDHVKYAIAAIFILVFMIIIPPVLLLIYPLLFKLLGFCKLSESRVAVLLWRVMPIQLLDSFQSSFKDDLRFFAGLYFLYRAIILGLYAYSPTLLIFYGSVQVQLTLLLAVHAIFQPYKKRIHNIIDLLILTNLAIINSITLYNLNEKLNVAEIFVTEIKILKIIQTALILLPFLGILAGGVYKLNISYKKWRNIQKDFDALPSLRSCESDPLLN